MTKDYKYYRFQLLGYLGQGILPFEQWAHVFANPELSSRPGLICKAFSVWFPTMLDYLNRPKDIELCLKKLGNDRSAAEAIDLCIKLEKFYKQILSAYSREEQVFVNDRRLQNVHGVLSVFRLDMIHVKFYDHASDLICKEHISADDYHKIMRNYYPEHSVATMNLRNRLVESEKFSEFGKFYDTELKIDPHLMNLASKLDIPYDSTPERVSSITPHTPNL